MRSSASGSHVDPVCGMRVEPARAAAHLVHDGQDVYFCSVGCSKRFAANPAQFLPSPSAPGGLPMASAPVAATQSFATATTSTNKLDGQPSADDPARGWSAYIPFAVVVGLIGAATAALAWGDARAGTIEAESVLLDFMTGFFLVFAGFKLLDLRGFADGYATYDLLAQRLPAYAWLYPFIELGFGLVMLAGFHPDWLLWTEAGVMAFSGLGVALKLAKREPFTCACLGTFLKVPLTKVTLVEDFGMAALAVAVILLR